MPPEQDLQSVLWDYFRKDQFATGCGIELLTISPGEATARLQLGPRHLNALGTVQGGAIFTLADYTFAAASNSHGTVAVGINVSISYIKAARTGTLFAHARELSKNFKLGSYEVLVKDDHGDLVAIFQGMVYRKKDEVKPLPEVVPGM